MDRLDKIQLTQNFTLDELIYSRTADVKGLDNYPEQEELDNLIYLTESILQPLRDKVGPIFVTSGYRGSELNKAIGGDDESQHSQGLAVDIYSSELNNYDLAKFLKSKFEFDQLILEKVPKSNPRKGWVHISMSRNKNRNEVLSFVKNTEDSNFTYVLGLQFTKHL